MSQRGDNKCSHCKEEIWHQPAEAGVPGGDWYSGCEVCGWHCEMDNEDMPRLRQTLGLNEIVYLKKSLNILFKKMLRDSPIYGKTIYNPEAFNDQLEILREISEHLVEYGDEDISDDVKWVTTTITADFLEDLKNGDASINEVRWCEE